MGHGTHGNKPSERSKSIVAGILFAAVWLCLSPAPAQAQQCFTPDVARRIAGLQRDIANDEKHLGDAQVALYDAQAGQYTASQGGNLDKVSRAANRKTAATTRVTHLERRLARNRAEVARLAALPPCSTGAGGSQGYTPPDRLINQGSGH